MYKNKKFKQKKSIGTIHVIIISIFISATSIFLYNMYQNINIDNSSSQSNNVQISKTSADSNSVSGSSTSANPITDTIEKVNDSVVGISRIKNTGLSIFLKDGAEQMGLGTGFIVSEDGYIVTNQHVAGSKFEKCYVTLEDGENLTGDVVWSDADLDLAIVKIASKNLPFVTLGDSEYLKPGENVYAIGNPIGFEFRKTVTAGIISAINRTIQLDENGTSIYMEDLLQTDATINPGNSGGPLINSDGLVVGINSVKITSAEGIGFAIPINLIKPIVDKFNNSGSFLEAYLGIFGFDKNVIPYMNSNITLNSGIYVAKVDATGPCYNSGLKEGDIITKIDGIQVNKMINLESYIYSKSPKDVVTLTVTSGNKESEIKITLGSKS